MVDVRTLPRLEGAVEEVARTEILSFELQRPDRGSDHDRRDAQAAGRQWLDGIRAPVEPIQPPDVVQEGRHGLFVSFSQGPGRPDQSVVYYSADRLYADVPFPDDATDIVYDDRGGPI